MTRGAALIFTICGFIQTGSCFHVAKVAFARPSHAQWAQNDKNSMPNPFQGISGMLSNMDDVIDDFMSKRMGNGEVFYGKRKVNPSNRPNTEGRYNGMGMTDKLKIDVTREVKEEALEKKRQKQQQQREQ